MSHDIGIGRAPRLQLTLLAAGRYHRAAASRSVGSGTAEACTVEGDDRALRTGRKVRGFVNVQPRAVRALHADVERRRGGPGVHASGVVEGIGLVTLVAGLGGVVRDECDVRRVVTVLL